MRIRETLQATAFLAFALWATPMVGKQDGPTIVAKKVDHKPDNFQYFAGSDVILYQSGSENNIYRSPDGGVTWDLIDAVPKGRAWGLYIHEYDDQRAYILTQGIQHYRTSDRGKTWEMFQTDAETTMFRSDVLQFHAGDPDRIIFNGMDCVGILCSEVAMYTTDGFQTAAEYLRGNTVGCWWAKSSREFTTGREDHDKQRILCIVREAFTSKQEQRLFVSDNYFQAVDKSGIIQEFEPPLDMNRPVRGIVNVAVVKKFMLVATSSANTDEMALFVSDDTLKWHRAMFPAPHDSHDHRVLQEAYTVLESTNYSIQIDVMTTRPWNPTGVLFTSNSNGTHFTENIEHTNRNMMGHVDFEKISGIQGIFLVNKVKNWEDVEKNPRTEKQIVSEITFDDGRTFDDVTADGKRIHLHSVTDMSNLGRVYSSPAPGLVMGIGNGGDYLESYLKGKLYVSDDAGLTWTKALDGPHKYEFGDQGSVLIAIRDSEKADVNEINYSLDHGVHWEKVPLPNEISVRPYFLTTTPDSTSLKFVLVGMAEESWQIIAIDFDGLHEATCTGNDLEKWSARVDKKGQPRCLMGHKQSFERRKKTAQCFLKREFRQPAAETADCDCTDTDYECDYNFVKEDGKCVQRGPIAVPEHACKDQDPNATFSGTSGYRKIPGNTCKATKEMDDKYKRVERKCNDILDTPSGPATDEIKQKFNAQGNWNSIEKHYLERGETSSSSDETIIVRPRNSGTMGPIRITHDHGKSWSEPEALKGKHIIYIIPHHYFKDMVFFVTDDKKVIYTVDRGVHFHTFDVPDRPISESLYAQYSPLVFHPDKKDWFLWLGEKRESGESYGVASYTRDRGDHWETGPRFIKHCEFTGSAKFRFPDRKEEQVVCLKREREDVSKENPWTLAVSNSWQFVDEKVQQRNVKEFATMAEFIVVATENTTTKTLEAHASLDGTRFAEAHFPAGFEISHQHAYTVLDSSTHAVNLFLVTETAQDREYGTIMKSNSNGTSYVMSINNVNCNDKFYVDFEKMLGLEGVALVNVVSNPEAKGSTRKALQTKITHNDGAQWAFLPPPAKEDEFGSFCKPTKSGKGDTKCALHIHGFTERSDFRNTYSSQSAVGLMLGWGNVGSSLGTKEDADTFMTTDAGLSWKRVKKGRWSWALGDHGSIIVLVQSKSGGVAKTKIISYSLDEGASWKDHEFMDHDVTIVDLTTMRSGSSLNFILWGWDGDTAFTINLDFAKFSERVCRHDEKDASKSDYYVWSPEHPLTGNHCLFGHVAQYLRKKADRKCHNDFTMQQLYNKQNCTCTRQDFECDYNFELGGDAQCKLVQGLQPASPEQFCKENPGASEYYEPSGYRRIPLTTCVDGQQLDKANAPHPCPGHEEEYKRAHAVSGFAILSAVVLSVGAAAGLGWWAFRNFSGKFGQIRLGEHPDSATFDSDRPWIKYPIMALGAVVTVAAAVPGALTSTWRATRSAVERWGWAGASRGRFSRLAGAGTRPFTTRDSFARAQGEFESMDEDEGELLGEESDEE